MDYAREIVNLDFFKFTLLARRRTNREENYPGQGSNMCH